MALDQVNEEAESWYSATLTDQDGDAMLTANVATLLYSIYELDTEAFVNSRDQVDLRNGGAWDQGAVIDGSGILTLRLEPDDNAVVSADNAGRSEIHVLVFEGTTAGSPSYAFKHEYEYEVKNFVKTT